MLSFLGAGLGLKICLTSIWREGCQTFLGQLKNPISE